MKKIGSCKLGDEPVGLYLTNYVCEPGKTIAIVANCEGSCPEPFATITINLSNYMEPMCFVLHHDMNKYEKDLMATGWFEDTGGRVTYGFVTNQPVWKLIKPV